MSQDTIVQSVLKISTLCFFNFFYILRGHVFRLLTGEDHFGGQYSNNLMMCCLLVEIRYVILMTAGANDKDRKKGKG